MEVRLNNLIEGFSGKLGDVVFRTLANGKVVMSRRPVHKRITEHQRRIGNQMKQAHARAADIMENDPVRTEVYRAYAKRRRNGGIRQAIVADILSKPKIHSINLQGTTLSTGNAVFIEATDDHRVEKVTVCIYAGDEIVEQGEAVEAAGLYVYTIKQTSTSADRHVIVEVSDFAGNTTQQTHKAEDLETERLPTQVTEAPAQAEQQNVELMKKTTAQPLGYQTDPLLNCLPPPDALSLPPTHSQGIPERCPGIVH